MPGNNAEEDPGFPVGGDVNPREAPTYNFAKFSEKLYEIEKIFPVAPPLRSATGVQQHLHMHTQKNIFTSNK